MIPFFYFNASIPPISFVIVIAKFIVMNSHDHLSSLLGESVNEAFNIRRSDARIVKPHGVNIQPAYWEGISATC
jgi:hypothetical protein